MTGADRRVTTGGRARLHDGLAGLVLLVAVVIVVTTFRDYGVTTDEEVQNEYGKLLLRFYGSLFADRAAFDYINLYYYGGLFDLLAALANTISPFAEYETRHLLGGLVGVLTAAGAGALARRLAGPRAGLLATLLTVVTPSLYGHAFNNPKDVPFAAGMVWTLWAVVRIAGELPRPRLASVLGLGLAFGLALSVRVGAVMALVWLAAVLVAHLVVTRPRAGTGVAVALRATAATAGRVVVALLPAVPVAAAVTALFWPWVVQEPLNFVRAVTLFSHFPIGLETLFAGTWYAADALPALYLPGYLAVKLPEVVLVGLALAAGAGGAALLAMVRRRGPLPAQAIPLGVVVLAVVLPVAAFVILRPTAYNEVRHFLFVLPPMIVLAAIGLDRGLARAEARSRRIGGMAVGVCAVAVAVQTAIMVVLHPHQYIYYNVLTGGVPGAVGRFELDYWGNALAEASRWLGEHVRPEAEATGRTFAVSRCGNRLGVITFFPPWLREGAVMTDDVTFHIRQTHAGCGNEAFGPSLYVVERFGVPLAVVERIAERRPHR